MLIGRQALTSYNQYMTNLKMFFTGHWLFLKEPFLLEVKEGAKPYWLTAGHIAYVLKSHLKMM